MTIRALKTKKGVVYQVDVTKRNFADTGKAERFRQSYNDETLAKIVELKVKAAFEAGSVAELDKLRGGSDPELNMNQGRPELSWYRLIDIAERDHWKTQSEGYQKTALINARQIARFFGAETAKLSSQGKC
ncbi:hypothetical protein LH51_08630 [Nitrincola sp. A-D6]|uniref:hypothetical protein n=1 Tax=Nitrincola sp. A-D6 TaxID=1545442 RepID=UPI00051F8ACB|nr:hypothetical protein [Nitrincola sp. A-D6]KGK42287.1 hypothetical protein LH51_08630 [Nitrincola sp. A-D6]